MTCQYNGRLAGLILASGPISPHEYLTNWYFMIPEFYWHRRIGRVVGYDIYAGTDVRAGKVFRNHDSQVLGKLADVSLEQAPGARSDCFLPARVIGGEPRAEGRCVRFVERHALLGQLRTEFEVESFMIRSLQPCELHGVPLDDLLHVRGKPLPEFPVRNQIEAGPAVVGETHIFLHF